MTRRKVLILAISFAISALFVWLVLRRLDLAEGEKDDGIRQVSGH